MKESIRSIDVRGRRVMVREDFNVPIMHGRIESQTRLLACLPTLEDLSARGARVIITSHLGRPGGHPNPELSLRPVAARLGELLHAPVAFASDCIGAAARVAIDKLAPGGFVLLENVRFHPEEEANDPVFARELASLAELFVNDAFGSSHRSHASVVGVAQYLPAYAGSLMLAELSALHRALDNPARPLVAVVGGAKVSTKVGVLRHLLIKVDRLIVAGAMANNFLRAQGIPVGASLIEEDALAEAAEVARLAGDRLFLPVDAVCAPSLERPEPTSEVDIDQVPRDLMILDIGRKSAASFDRALAGAKTVVWNGPPGAFEYPQFRAGTRLLAESIINCGAYSLVGGGDTAAAVAMLKLGDRFSYVSTGGGATLEYMEGKGLPGVAVLSDVGARLQPLISPPHA
ncbi:MAG TPA: phosphoglycerate kinase [Candidatus Acidoferrales bacterium]|nr:phosphoglycerate kinase [Candidatus Acidoferrales bacterium]